MPMQVQQRTPQVTEEEGYAGNENEIRLSLSAFLMLLLLVLLVFALILTLCNYLRKTSKSDRERKAKSFTGFIRSCDIFFHAPVGLRYKGSGKYKTLLGGVLSLLVVVILAFYLPVMVL